VSEQHLSTSPGIAPAEPECIRMGHYELRGRLGQGGYGIVYEAWDSRLHREVAIKRIELIGDSPSWVREARLAAHVRHRAFVAVHEVFVEQQHGHIVMELVHGTSLAALVAAGPVPQSQALPWMIQAADALAEAHRLNVVHGDIKPANMMIDSLGQLRILDFGIARSTDRLATFATATGTPPAGTLAYMAPEQLLGVPANVSTDIHALGLVFHELLSGRRTFADRDGLVLAHRKLHVDGAGPRPCGIAAPLYDLIERMVQRHPDLRPASMQEVHDTLLALEHPAVSAAKQAAGTAARPWWAWWRRWRMVAAPTVVFIALLGAAVSTGHLLPLRTSASPWTDRLSQADTLLRAFDDEGAVERAIALLEGVLSEKPGQQAAAATLALAYCMQYGSDSRDDSWLQRAQVSAQMAMRSEDQSAVAHSANAWVLEFKTQHPEAEAAYQRALALDSRDFYALWGYSRMLTRLHRHDDARRVIDKARSVYPDERLFLDTLGTLFYQLGDYPHAEQAFRESIAKKPAGVVAYANLNATLTRENRMDEGLAVLQQGLRIRPHGPLYSNLGTALFFQGRYLEAAEAFQRGISSRKGSPNDYLKWANLADALRWVPGREADSRAAYAHALQLLDPLLKQGGKDATLLSRAGLYAAKLGDATRAQAWTTQALAQAAPTADLLFRAAVVAELTGSRDTALERLQQARLRGYPPHFIDQEPDLVALRRDLRYHQLIMEEKK
jgi:eukaryotic-like serine/threonine-protein kinase